MDRTPSSATVKAAQVIAGAAAAFATRGMVTAAYERLTGREAPEDPTDPAVDWAEAITWTVAASVAAGVSRVVGRRLATKVVADI